MPWLVIGVVDATGEEDRGDDYFVRAIFDNASSLVQGEDVKIAGAAVGVVDSLEVAPGKKAAVILRIDNKDFTPWHQDASCMIRPQSLIGEKFVECKPGTTSAPKLRTLASGDGEGERLPARPNSSSPGGPRPAERHPAPALPAAAGDPAERVRHRARGPGRDR